MQKKIPEISMSLRRFHEMEQALRREFTDLKLDAVSLKVIGEKKSEFKSVHELYEHLRGVEPRTRSYVQFEYLVTAAISNTEVRITLRFAMDEDESYVKASGSKKSKKVICERAHELILPFKRAVPTVLFFRLSTAFFLLAVLGASLAFPIFKEQFYAGLFTSILSIAFSLYFHHRAHAFLVSSLWDHVLVVLPSHANNINDLVFLFVRNLAPAIIIFSIFQYFGISNYWLNNSEAAKAKVMRSLVTSNIVDKVERLTALNQVFDEQGSEHERVTVAREMSEVIQSLVGSDGVLNNQALRNFPVLVSSAHQLQKGNWLTEPLLLLRRMDSRNQSFKYVPRLKVEEGDIHITSISNWQEEPILKDDYGTTWTRLDLLKGFSYGNASSKNEKQLALERLQNHADNQLQFVPFGGTPMPPQNSPDSTSIRAISEEVVRSWNVVRRKLSENSEADSAAEHPK